VIVALIIGTLLAVGALAFVLYPIFFDVARPPMPAPRVEHSERDRAVVALREIEFDRATGKLSDVDYAELKTRYTREAIDAMRREDAQQGVAVGERPSDDELEAVVRAYRAHRAKCPACGPRPEDDASFCSNCGRYLRDRCAGCGAPVEAHDARYCVNCGQSLAAA
jgi:hypothetical protein